MQSDNIIDIKNLSKVYRIWNSPKGRFKAILYSLIQKLDSNGYKKYTSKQSQEFFALKDISFSIKKGESIGIVGLNGSGKSTLLQIIAGTLTKSSGKRFVNGRIAALLELGSGFNPEFTGKENVYLNGSILGLTPKEIDKKYDQIVQFAEIGEFVNRPVKTYSSGMIVRLAFAVLTQVDPDILIVDEALAVGDMHFQHKCVRFIKEFLKGGKTLLFVSHDPGAVKTLCHRAILLNKGEIIKDSNSEEILNYYNGIIAQQDVESQVDQYKDNDGNVITRSGNKHIFFEKVTMTDQNNQPMTAFSIGQESNIDCTLKVKKAVKNPTVGFTIYNRLGTEIFGTNTKNLDTELGTLQVNSRVVVRFKLPMALGAGSYSISVAAHENFSHIDKNYDWIDNALIFKILPRTKNIFVGCVEIQTKIEVIPI
jgi:lipopolysaccharide transport system ATP-binding protein